MDTDISTVLASYFMHHSVLMGDPNLKRHAIIYRIIEASSFRLDLIFYSTGSYRKLPRNLSKS